MVFRGQAAKQELFYPNDLKRGGRTMNKIISNFLILIAALFLFSGCSSRIDEPIVEENATIIYPPKQEGDITAKINFCRRINKKTGEAIGEGVVFSMIEDGVLYSVTNFYNHTKHIDNGLVFHYSWIGPNGKSLFSKQIEIPAGDSTASITSSTSISPEKREAGEYTFKLYYFRELIAEKHFTLLPALHEDREVVKKLAPEITLYRLVSKKTGKLVGEGTLFKRKAKRKVRAAIDLQNRFAFGEQELMFHIQWRGPEGDTIFRKRYDFYPADSSSTIKSSISISPEKRQAGDYNFQLLLFNKVIAEQPFELE